MDITLIAFAEVQRRCNKIFPKLKWTTSCQGNGWYYCAVLNPGTRKFHNIEVEVGNKLVLWEITADSSGAGSLRFENLISVPLDDPASFDKLTKALVHYRRAIGLRRSRKNLTGSKSTTNTPHEKLGV